jgi:hypothetical protein
MSNASAYRGKILIMEDFPVETPMKYIVRRVAGL